MPSRTAPETSVPPKKGHSFNTNIWAFTLRKPKLSNQSQSVYAFRSHHRIRNKKRSVITATGAFLMRRRLTGKIPGKFCPGGCSASFIRSKLMAETSEKG